MKKLLLASTVLVASAGVAAAEVALSGDGRMGIVYDGSDWGMTSRARVTFTLSGETSTGLAFGGSFRADNAGGAADGSAGEVFISGEFGKLSLGDVSGAARAAVGDLYGVGLTGLGDRNEMNYVDRLQGTFFNEYAIAAFSLPTNSSYAPSGGFLPRAQYEYSIDGFTLFASVGHTKTSTLDRDWDDDNYVNDIDLSPASVSVTELGIGASYNIDAFTVALGYENTRFKATGVPGFTAGHLIGSAEYSMDGISVKGIVGQALNDLRDEVDVNTQYGLSVSGEFDEVSVTAFGRRDFMKNVHFGLGASYDLGGGASLMGGVAQTNPNNGSTTTVADFGVSFSF